MNIFLPIGKVRFSFYITIYFCILSLFFFLLFSYGLIGNNFLFNNQLIIYFIIFLFILYYFIFIRVRDITNIGLLISGLYIIPILSFYFIGIYMGAMNLILMQFFVLLFNPFFPLILILILSFKDGKKVEDFNLKLITNNFFGAFFFSENFKNKIINNKIIILLYKYFFILFLFGIFIILYGNNDRLFQYKGYNNYYNIYTLKESIYKEYSKDNVIINEFNRYEKGDYGIKSLDELLENKNINPISSEVYYNEKDKLYKKINIELNNKKNGLRNEIYFMILFYLGFGFIILKFLPLFLYFLKVPLTILYLYIKNFFSKLEKIEEKLKSK